MGKKIPKSRRHKKLKFVDPCYSGPPPRNRRKNILPNEPPLEDDYQEVPRQLEEFVQLKEKAKSNKFKRKKKKKVLKDEFIIVKRDVIEDNEPGMTTAIKRMPTVIKQRASENENQFFNRLQKMTNQAIAEAKVEEKYNIKLVNIDEKGNAEYVSGEKEVSESKKRKREKYKEIVKEKKKMRAKDEEFDLKKEHIQFGEVATAPPILTAKPRKAPEGVKRLAHHIYLDCPPDVRENLVLMNFVDAVKDSETSQVGDLKDLKSALIYPMKFKSDQQAMNVFRNLNILRGGH